MPPCCAGAHQVVQQWLPCTPCLCEQHGGARQGAVAQLPGLRGEAAAAAGHEQRSETARACVVSNLCGELECIGHI